MSSVPKKADKLNLSLPDSKVHKANMGPTWDLSVLDWPHDDPMNLATRVVAPEDVASENNFGIITVDELRSILCTKTPLYVRIESVKITSI